MPSIFPETMAGGVFIRDASGNPLYPQGVENAYAPAAGYISTCQFTALPSDCTARWEPRQANAIVSEMLSLAECWDADGAWDCGTPHNLCTSFNSWVNSTQINQIGNKVDRAGDTMTGDLTIQKNGPTLQLVRTVSSGGAAIVGNQGTYGNYRWSVVLGDGTAEQGGNTGSNFEINRFADDGSLLGSALEFDRATGSANFYGQAVNIDGNYYGPVTLDLRTNSPGQAVTIWGGNLSTGHRWAMQLGEGTAETGGDAGSNFAIYNCSDNGAVKSGALQIRRTDAHVTLSETMSVARDPAAPLEVATKQYVDNVSTGGSGGAYVNRTGDTMTGDLHINANGVMISGGAAQIQFNASGGVNNTGFQIGRSLSGTNSNDFYIYNAVAGNTPVFINNAGFIGIDTSNPVVQLDVNGDIRARDTIQIQHPTSSQLQLLDANGTVKYQIGRSLGGGNAQNFYIVDTQSGSAPFIIAPNGAIGINNLQNPVYSLDVNGSFHCTQVAVIDFATRAISGAGGGDAALCVKTNATGFGGMLATNMNKGQYDAAAVCVMGADTAMGFICAGSNNFTQLAGSGTVNIGSTNVAVGLVAGNNLAGVISPNGTLTWGNPTPGASAPGVINAQAVFDDSVQLTCFGVEQLIDGKLDVEKWDQRSSTGRSDLVHRFKDMLDAGYQPDDPASYIDRLMQDRALPGMPNEAEWKQNGQSLGEIHNRLWLSVELLAAAFVGNYSRQEQRIRDLEAQVAALLKE
jgi:hypothetical protein